MSLPLGPLGVAPLPLGPLDAFTPSAGLAIAVVIGFGFGFTLERGGFGSSRRLAAQFYLYDMTVFKVMFSAIVTAMLGFFALARIGWLDPAMVWINPTFLWPQLAGGFLLGVGFVISGYCPGTAIVASASGKIDGMLSLAGVALGILLHAAFGGEGLAAFQKSGDHGRLLLSDWLHISPGWLALGVAVVAALAFLGAEKVERIFASRAEPGRAPALDARRRNRIMLAVVSAAFILALVPRMAPPARAGAAVSEITPLDLARSLVEGRSGLVVLDTRNEAAFAAGSVPGARNVPLEQLRDAEAWSDKIPPGRVYVVVGEGGEAALLDAPAGTALCFLKDGYAGWKRDILDLPGAGAAAPAAVADAAERAALHAWFTGTEAAPARAAAPSAAPAAGTGARKKKPGGGC